MPLSERDYIEAAQMIGCEVAAIKAVAEVESRGGGFLPDGRPKILFEAHIFGRLTGHRHSRFRNISSRYWNRLLYKGGAGEYVRLDQAVALDREAALQSCSWGRFQIMGFNFRLCGFRIVQEFVNAHWRDEGEHLKAFVRFVQSNRLDDELRDKRWAAFALGYNGPGFRKNKYDEKMAAAYEKYRRQL